jgi:MOSC domain-containing protein YiiM
MSACVQALWMKRAMRGVIDSVEQVTMVTNGGIEGDANFGRSKRQVTIIDEAVFDTIRLQLPGVEAYMRRANIMVRGIELRDTRDHLLSVGDVRIRICGETRPCERMDAQVSGLTAALDPDWRGGVFGVVLNDGIVSVGDEVSLESP